MKQILALLVAVAFSLAISACSKTEEGTAEKAGKKIDQAMQDAKNYTGEKMQQAGEAMEKAGEDVQK